MIELNNVSFSYKKEVVLYSNFNLKIKSGLITSIIGKNGTGKSTLINIILGFLKAEGEVKLDSTNPSLIFQEPMLFKYLTIRKNLEIVLNPITKDKDLINKTIKSSLEANNLLEYIDSYPRELSLGMQQKVSLIRGLITKPKLLILDEPFNSLDEVMQDELLKIIINYKVEENSTILIVTHDLQRALKLSDEIIVLGHRPIEVISSISKSNDKEFNYSTLFNYLKNS
jgi:ABC-type nitrate/sulfonate/bicarbonate transport system ATPase subunit